MTVDLTPEHNARDQEEGLHPEVQAAYRYVESVICAADAKSPTGYAWHGWALREAFLAGCSHAARAALKAQSRPVERPIWTEGVCGDGAAILKDGVMQPIEDVITALNAAEAAKASLHQPDRYELGDAILRAWRKHGHDSWCSIADDVLAELQALAQPGPDTSQLSDGYHTFADLYEHRHALCLALMRAMPQQWWFSRRHDDGEPCFGGDDWFIVGADLPGLDDPSVTYHLPMRLWETAQATGAQELPKGRPWDGHSAQDVVDRFMLWAALKDQSVPVGATDLSPVQETAPERIWLHLNGANEWLPFKDEEGVIWSPDQIDESDIPYVRADLQRYGHPTITPIPISERLPGPEDCAPWPDEPEANHWCWLAKVADGGWEWSQVSALGIPAWRLERVLAGGGWTHWLPHWALSVPATSGTA